MYCTKCGRAFTPEQQFCGSCGAKIAHAATEPVVVPTDLKHDNVDISWNFLVANLFWLFGVAWLTYPGRNEMQGLPILVEVAIRAGVPALFSVIIVAIFRMLRPKKEMGCTRTSFVIASWVLLGLIIFGERSGTNPPHKSSPQTLSAVPTANSEGWTQESTESNAIGPWLDHSPPGTRFSRDFNGTIYRLYPPGVRPDAAKANPFGLAESTEMPQ